MSHSPAPSRVHRLVSTALLCLAIGTSPTLGADVPALPGSYAPDEILVGFRPLTSGADRSTIAARVGGAVTKERPRIGYTKITLDPGTSVAEALARILDDPRVLWAEPNGIWTTSECADCPQDPMLQMTPLAGGEQQWGIFHTGIPSQWRHGGGGSPTVTIAILDTGIDDFSSPHDDLADNVIGGHDFVDDDAIPTDVGATGGYGHGTHVAGIAAAVANDVGIAGVAYCSSLLIGRVLDCSGGEERCPGSWEDIADGIAWAADEGADVINLSLGGDTGSTTVRNAIGYAMAEGVTVVAASGNDDATEVSFPARYPEVIAVGAIDSDNEVADFSNHGPNLDVVAPGVDVWSPIPGGWGSKQGTSMAAPFVSGVAALLLSRNPDMTALEVDAYLAHIAEDTETPSEDGHGVIRFPRLHEWSDDALTSTQPARHETYFWEWLGEDATWEYAPDDASNDLDGVPNFGGDPHAADGADDGIFPLSIPTLPILPPHLGEGPEMLTVAAQVCRWDGPRYDGSGPHDEHLYLDVYVDWNANAMHEPFTTEHVIPGLVEDPSTWGTNHKILAEMIPVLDEHIWGNPLRVRGRLSYGSPSLPAETKAFGETEDDHIINYVEDFDVSLHTEVPGLFIDLGDFELVPDGGINCPNHGAWEYAFSGHPAIGDRCNGVIENVNIMATPPFDLTEYTDAFLRFWYCHQAWECGPLSIEECRVQVTHCGGTDVIFPFPASDSGTVLLDLSDYVGCDHVVVEFVEETDLDGFLMIDDIVVWAYDDEAPETVLDLAITRSAGSNAMDARWTTPAENDVSFGPPAEPVASSYQVRYAADPILTGADWRSAMPLSPWDAVAPFPVPEAPGAVAAGAFHLPSAIQGYHLAMRTQDEVVNLGTISNTPFDATPPLLGVTVTSLNDTTAYAGDEVSLRFRVTNEGNVRDGFSMTAGGTEAAWTHALGNPFVALAPGADQVLEVEVGIADTVSVETIDAVTLTAVSISDGVTSDADAGEVTALPDILAAGDGGELGPALRLGPNPFRVSTHFSVTVGSAGPAWVAVYDAQGRRIRVLHEGTLTAGTHRLAWDGRDERGRTVASGVYFVEIDAPSVSARSRLLRL